MYGVWRNWNQNFLCLFIYYQIHLMFVPNGLTFSKFWYLENQVSRFSPCCTSLVSDVTSPCSLAKSFWDSRALSEVKAVIFLIACDWPVRLVSVNACMCDVLLTWLEIRSDWAWWVWHSNQWNENISSVVSSVQRCSFVPYDLTLHCISISLNK